MGLYRVDGPAGPVNVEIAGNAPTPDEIRNIIVPAYERHVQERTKSNTFKLPGLQAPGTSMGAGAAALAGAGAPSPEAAGFALGDPLANAPTPKPPIGDAAALAIYNLEQRERERMASERAENMLEQGVGIGAGFAIGGPAGMLARSPLGKSVGAFLETGAARRAIATGTKFAGRVGLNVGAGQAGAATKDAYREYVEQQIANGELPAGFLRPDFKARDYRDQALFDLAVGGVLEGGISTFRTGRRKLFSVPGDQDLTGKLATARDLQIDLSIGDVTKNKLFAGFARVMNSIPVVRNIAGTTGFRAKRTEQVLGAYERLFNNPFAPRSMFHDLGVDMTKGIRKDTSILLGAADAKLTKARLLGEERGVSYSPQPLLDSVDKSIMARTDLAIPTTFTRRTAQSSTTSREASGTTSVETTGTRQTGKEAATSVTDVARKGTTEDFLAGTGPVPFDRQKVESTSRQAMSEATTQAETTRASKGQSVVNLDKVVTSQGTVPDFLGDTSVDEWMIALGGMDPNGQISVSELMELRNSVTEAWQKTGLNHQQKTFLYDIERTIDTMLENTPDPDVAQLIQEGWRDLGAFRASRATPGAQEFTKLDKNIFERSSKVVPGGTYADELFEYVAEGIGQQRWGSERIGDLYQVMGPDVFRAALDSKLARVGQKHFRVEKNGDISFNWDGIRQELGLNSPSVAREGLDRALKLSGTGMTTEKMAKQIDELEKLYGKKWVDTGEMAQRRFSLGGAAAVRNMLVGGAVLGSGVFGGVHGLALAAELGILGRYLNNPKALQTILNTSKRDMGDAAILAAQQRMVTMFARDWFIQNRGRFLTSLGIPASGSGTPTQQDLEEAENIIRQRGGIAPPRMPLTEYGPTAPLGSNINSQLQGIADYIKGK